MTEQDEPLSVRVARVLGWDGLVYISEDDCWLALGPDMDGESCEVPDYEHDWRATGPLIEANGLTVLPLYDTVGTLKEWRSEQTLAFLEHPEFLHPLGKGSEPAQSICYWVLAAHEAGLKVYASVEERDAKER